jgi:hypothetical protein
LKESLFVCLLSEWSFTSYTHTLLSLKVWAGVQIVSTSWRIRWS